MIRISEESKAAYKNDFSDKQVVITIPGKETTLTNDDLILESMELKEAIESGENLSFTGCIASSLTFETLELFDDTLVGEYITADITAMDEDGEPTETVPLFRGFVDVVTNLTHEEYTSKIRAYDALYLVNQMDVTAWRNSLTFPISVYNLRNSFFNYIGLEQVADYLPNDNINIPSPQIEDAVVTGGKIIKALCSINGRFGRISRNGLFEYVHLVEGTEAIYPAEDLYPADDLYPHAENAVDNVAKANYSTLEFENYQTEPIGKVQVINKNGAIVSSFGEGTNTFTLKDNPLVWGLNQENVNQVAINLYNTVRGIWYIPARTACVGLPYVECGDFIVLNARRSLVRAYVLQRTLKGVKALTDEFVALGDKTQPSYIPSLQSQVNANTTAIETETSRASSAESSLNTGLNNTNNRISQVNADLVNTKNIVAGKANISDLNATNANVNNLSAQVGNINNLVASKASISDLNALRASINSLDARVASIALGTFRSVNCNNITSGSASFSSCTVGGRNVDTRFGAIESYITRFASAMQKHGWSY